MLPTQTVRHITSYEGLVQPMQRDVRQFGTCGVWRELLSGGLKLLRLRVVLCSGLGSKIRGLPPMKASCVSSRLAAGVYQQIPTNGPLSGGVAVMHEQPSNFLPWKGTCKSSRSITEGPCNPTPKPKLVCLRVCDRPPPPSFRVRRACIILYLFASCFTIRHGSQFLCLPF